MLNANEINFLRWMRSDCDWGQITWPADHDEYDHIDPNKRWEEIHSEIKWAMQYALKESAFDQEELSTIDPGKIADVIWDDGCDKYFGVLPLSAAGNETPKANPPLKIFAKARVNKNLKLITFDCVGLSSKNEPGLIERRKMIEEVKAIVQAALSKAHGTAKINSIH
ncbi:MAG TPA: hypothetical protein DF383_10300 [Deltaproteobacteria bacterium]|nr:hypothetical protein [Deltaproteobacteria bacterium]